MNDRIIIYESFTMIREMEVIDRNSLIFDPTTTWVLFRCLLSQTGAFFSKTQRNRGAVHSKLRRGSRVSRSHSPTRLLPSLDSWCPSGEAGRGEQTQGHRGQHNFMPSPPVRPGNSTQFHNEDHGQQDAPPIDRHGLAQQGEDHARVIGQAVAPRTDAAGRSPLHSGKPV